MLLTRCLLTATNTVADERPNFVPLIAGDISDDGLGCNGGIDARTPNIDALAKEGPLFTSAYLAASNCNPSRSSTITRPLTAQQR